MNKEQDTVEKLLADYRRKPPKWRLTISIADELPDRIGLPKFNYKLEDRILFLVAKETELAKETE